LDSPPEPAKEGVSSARSTCNHARNVSGPGALPHIIANVTVAEHQETHRRTLRKVFPNARIWHSPLIGVVPDIF
jgi:hypothetical protein